EKIFKTLKTRDLGIRPIRHYTENRTRAHVFLCMLAAHLTWHLRTALAPLTFTDQNRPVPEEPVAKVHRSEVLSSALFDDDGGTSIDDGIDRFRRQRDAVIGIGAGDLGVLVATVIRVAPVSGHGKADLGSR